MSSDQTNELPDKRYLYGRYQHYENRRDRLGLRMAHKALDMSDDEMQINANRHGIGTAGVIGIAAAASLIPAAAMLLAGLGYVASTSGRAPDQQHQIPAQPQPQPQPPAIQSPITRPVPVPVEYDYSTDGGKTWKPIERSK